ncbi:WavE lipopolysaccharide synthesis family protein [Pseudomonas nitroreducens]|nr:WavE lipopolysaccharide synthesis family protein [Pseudomonas nitroreducens]
MTIDSSQLTVLLQGPLCEGDVDIAGRAIASIRAHLPRAQIVLSTTDMGPTPEHAGMVAVADGSASRFDDVNGNANNVNKLISTMVNGLALAEREYCLKLRTDHVVQGDRILALLGNAPKAKLFGERVSVSNLFLRNPTRLSYLFHLTDTLQFGRTDDLRKLWSIGELQADFVYLKHGPRINPIGNFQGYTSFRLLPEQAIFLRFAQSNGLDLDLPHISYTSFALFSAWEDLLVDNFDVHDWHSLAILPPKRFLSRPYAPETIMTAAEQRTLRSRRAPRQKALRYAHLLANKYLFCWLHRRWLVSVASLLLFSLSSDLAIDARKFYRRLTEASRV